VTPASRIHVHYQLWQRCGYLYYKYKQNNHCYGERMTCNEQSVFQQQFAIAKYNPNYTIYYNSNHQVTLRLESYLHCTISVQFTLSMQTSKMSQISLMSSRNKVALSTLPWGTPLVTYLHSIPCREAAQQARTLGI